MNFSETKQLLQQYYNLTSGNIPQQRELKEWKPENNVGFLLGIIAHGQDVHITQLHELLISKQFKDQEQFFINAMFDCYIRPFHKSYKTDSECCQTASDVSSRITSKTISRSNSIKDLEYVSEVKELSHDHFEMTVIKRDVVCLFCWDKIQCEAAHIFAQKEVPFPYDELSLFQRTGLKQKLQAQKGLLLCVQCHREFDALKRYVDVVDDKLVVKFVNLTNDETNEEWLDIMEGIKLAREGQLKFKSNSACKDGRSVVEPNGEMALYFVQNNPAKRPNRKALEFHKTACLIWRMAGGAEPDEEYCSDDDDLGPVDTAALRKRFNIQDSAATLNVIS